MVDEENVTVVVEDDYQSRIADVADGLRRLGMRVDVVHPLTGTITGAVTTERLSAVRAVAGVKSVRSRRDFRIAPPDADVQ